MLSRSIAAPISSRKAAIIRREIDSHRVPPCGIVGRDFPPPLSDDVMIDAELKKVMWKIMSEFVIHKEGGFTLEDVNSEFAKHDLQPITEDDLGELAYEDELPSGLEQAVIDQVIADFLSQFGEGATLQTASEALEMTPEEVPYLALKMAGLIDEEE